MPARTAEGNGMLPIVEHILMPISELRVLDTGRSPMASHEAAEGTLFSIDVVGHGPDPDPASGRRRDYCTYQDLLRDYLRGVIEPEALKAAVARAVNQVLGPIRDSYAANEEWREADRRGYPEDWPAATA